MTKLGIRANGSFRSDVSLSIGSSALAAAAGILTLALFSRFLSLEDLGAFNGIRNIAMFLVPFLSFSLRISLPKLFGVDDIEESGSIRAVHSLISITTIFGAVSAALVFKSTSTYFLTLALGVAGSMVASSEGFFRSIGRKVISVSYRGPVTLVALLSASAVAAVSSNSSSAIISIVAIYTFASLYGFKVGRLKFTERTLLAVRWGSERMIAGSIRKALLVLPIVFLMRAGELSGLALYTIALTFIKASDVIAIGMSGPLISRLRAFCEAGDWDKVRSEAQMVLIASTVAAALMSALIYSSRHSIAAFLDLKFDLIDQALMFSIVIMPYFVSNMQKTIYDVVVSDGGLSQTMAAGLVSQVITTTIILLVGGASGDSSILSSLLLGLLFGYSTISILLFHRISRTLGPFPFSQLVSLATILILIGGIWYPYQIAEPTGVIRELGLNLLRLCVACLLIYTLILRKFINDRLR